MRKDPFRPIIQIMPSEYLRYFFSNLCEVSWKFKKIEKIGIGQFDRIVIVMENILVWSIVENNQCLLKLPTIAVH